MHEIILPPLGEGIEKATLSYWYLKEGDKVKEKDDLAEFATDKATFNVPSPYSGVILKLLAKEGDMVKAGDKIAIVE